VHRRSIRILLALGVVAATLALAGCVNLKQVTGTQQSTFGDAQVTVVVCRSGAAGCADGGGNSGQSPAPGANVDVQLLLGYRVPVGARPPAEIRFFDDDGIGPLFTPSASYTAELQKGSPPPAGQQWFGYLSTPFTSTPGFTEAAIVTRFGMPVSADGTPQTSFPFRVVAGSREANGQTGGPGRPVRCNGGLYLIDVDTICVDSPSPAVVSGPSQILNVRDLGVAAGPSAAVTPGTTATVPFTFRTTGAVPGGTTATLTASTSVPGGVATPAPGLLPLGSNATAGASVSVAVPAGTPAGAYPVTLTARVGTDVRTSQGTVTVLATPGGGPGGPGGPGGGGAATLPTLRAGVAPKTIGRTRRSGPAIVRAVLSAPGNVRMAIARSAPGRRKANGVCAAPTRNLIRNGARKCTRFVPVGVVARPNLGAGARTVPFSGRGRLPGTYRLTLTLRSGGAVSAPVAVTVKVR